MFGGTIDVMLEANGYRQSPLVLVGLDARPAARESVEGTGQYKRSLDKLNPVHLQQSSLSLVG